MRNLYVQALQSFVDGDISTHGLGELGRTLKSISSNTSSVKEEEKTLLKQVFNVIEYSTDYPLKSVHGTYSTKEILALDVITNFDTYYPNI